LPAQTLRARAGRAGLSKRGTPRAGLLALILATAIALVGVLPPDGGPVLASSGYSVFPRGQIGVTRPTVGWLVWWDMSFNQDQRFERARMWLDGREVTAEWNGDIGAVTHTPPDPLAPGEHRVRVRLETECTTPGYYYEPVEVEFSFTVEDRALETLPEADGETWLVLRLLNRLRSEAGIGPVAYEPSLGAAAASHALYVARSPEEAHTETPGRPHFTGVVPWERTAYFGYWQGRTAEVVAYAGPAEMAVESWLATLYHRIPLVDPRNSLMGYGHAGAGDLPEVEVMELGPYEPGAEPDLVRWPYPGQEGVPTGWPGLEGPDPFRLYPGVSGPVGYTVTLTWAGEVEALTLDDWSLQSSAGEEVACMAFSPATDECLEATAALIPYEPLEPETTYTVSMSGDVDFGSGPAPYGKTWSFTTSSRALEVGPSIAWSWRWTGPDAPVTFEVEGLEVRRGVRVYLDGLPVRNLRLREDGFSFLLPAGFESGPWELLLVSPDGFELALEGDTDPEPGLPSAGGRAFAPAEVLLPDGTGALAPAPALAHVDGAVMVDQDVLAAAGAHPSAVPEIYRTHWTLEGHDACLTLGSAAGWVDGEMVLLDLPAQLLEGGVHVPVDFVRDFLAAVAAFWDMPGHWARDLVSRLAAEEIVGGVGDGRFRPELTLTRAAFTKMLVEARGLLVEPGGTGGFADTTGHWVSAQGYLAPAVKAGLVRPEEHPGGLFEPDGAITREEIAVMVVRALGLEDAACSRVVPVGPGGRAEVGGRVFTDAGEWGKPGHVAVAVEQGIITGYLEAGGATYTFRPHEEATRAEAAAMVVRMLDRPGG